MIFLALRCHGARHGEHHGAHLVGLPSYPQLRLWPDQAAHFAALFLGSDHDAQPLGPHTTKLRVRLKKSHLFCDDGCRLAAIYLPERRHSAAHSPAIEIVPVSPAQALVAFIRHSFATRFVNDIASQQRRLALFTPVVQQIPVRRLVYPNGFAYLPAVREAILKDIHTSLPCV